MKDLADARNNAEESKLTIGDEVLVQQPKIHKSSTPYKPVPFKVIEKEV